MNNNKNYILRECVKILTNQGLYTWQIARRLNITEAEVVKFQNRW